MLQPPDIKDNPNPDIHPIGSVGLRPIDPRDVTEDMARLMLPALLMGLPENRRRDLGAATNLLNAVSMGTLLGFAIESTLDARVSLLGFAFLGISTDPFTNERSLHIWSLYGHGGMSLDAWRDAFASLGELVEKLKLPRVVTAQTNNARVLDMVKGLGGTEVATLVRLEV